MYNTISKITLQAWQGTRNLLLILVLLRRLDTENEFNSRLAEVMIFQMVVRQIRSMDQLKGQTKPEEDNLA